VKEEKVEAPVQDNKEEVVKEDVIPAEPV